MHMAALIHPRPAARRGRRARALVAGLLLGSTTLSACYVNVPVARSPVAGSLVALRLNDRGRVAMENALGPSVDRVEGAVVRGTDDEYVLAVSTVATLDGNSSRWAGEQVTLRREFVRDETERRFSRGRTIAAVGAGVAAVAAFIITRSVIGSASADPDRKLPPDGVVDTRRLTRLP
jgi:hypothetical protein